VPTGSERSTLRGHTARVTSVAFSPDGQFVVTGSVDKTARIWNADSGQLFRTLTGHTNTINAVAWYSDDTRNWIATGSSDQSIRIWDGLTGQLIRTLGGAAGRTTAVAFSPDGATIVSGHTDGSVRFWNSETGEQTRRVQSCTSEISGVAYSPDGTTVAAGVRAQNSIPLDVFGGSQGNDLNLTSPLPLDASAAPAGNNYYLWAEVDTDRSDPVRTYARARVHVHEAFSSVIEDATPSIAYDSNDEAFVITAPTTDRQVFSLGQLNEGDRLILGLVELPGYSETFETGAPFSVLVVDDSVNPDDASVPRPEMLVWYQEDFFEKFVLFNQDTRVVAGHDGEYFVIIDGESTFTDTPGVSLFVRIERDFGVIPRPQTVYLNFAGGMDFTVAGLPPFTFGEFDANDINSAWGAAETATIKTKIIEAMEDAYTNGDGKRYNITFVSSDDAEWPGPNSLVLHFGGNIIEGDFALGIADYIDPRNDTVAGNGAIFTDDWSVLFFPAATAAEMGEVIGQVAAHETGHLLGMRHVEEEEDDIMYTPFDDLRPRMFLNSPLSGREQFNAQIGFQNGPRYLEEVLGLMP
jgi:hypothetical protein